jgi:hypothetical protein
MLLRSAAAVSDVNVATAFVLLVLQQRTSAATGAARRLGAAATPCINIYSSSTVCYRLVQSLSGLLDLSPCPVYVLCFLGLHKH